jgi:hypothetical protein
LRYQIVSLIGAVAMHRYMGGTRYFMGKVNFADCATLATLGSYGCFRVVNVMHLVLIYVHQRYVGRGRVRPGGGITGPARLLSGVQFDCGPGAMRFNRARLAWLLRI